MFPLGTQIRHEADCPFKRDPSHAHCRSLHLDNQHLRQLLADLEALLALREKELEQCQMELRACRSQVLPTPEESASSPSHSPEPDDVEISLGPSTTFLRPQPTDDELLHSSIWARSGQKDPSVELHPLLSAWYQFFCSTAPTTSNPDTDHTPILAPPEPALAPKEERHIPFSLPPYVFALLGPEAERKDQHLANEARRLIDSGRKIVPPPPTSNLFGDLGDWQNADFVTVLQAHNLRHCAVTDRDIFAIRTYKWLHTTYTDRSLRRSEGIQYLMKAFSGDVRFLR